MKITAGKNSRSASTKYAQRDWSKQKAKGRKAAEQKANRKSTIVAAEFAKLKAFGAYQLGMNNNADCSCCPDGSCLSKYCAGDMSKLLHLEPMFMETYLKGKDHKKNARGAAVLASIATTEDGKVSYNFRLRLGGKSGLVEHNVCRSCFEYAWGTNHSFTDRVAKLFKESQTATGSCINASARKMNSSSLMVGLSYDDVEVLIQEALDTNCTIIGDDYVSNAMAPNTRAGMLAYAYLDRLVEVEADQSPEGLEKYMNVS